MLSRDSFKGPWAGLPVAWTVEDRFDEETYRRDVATCCKAGVPGVYSGGTTGEFYAMEFDEFQATNRALVEEAQKYNVPSMVGCTSTYTLGVIRRARFAAELGADAVQIALPYWMEVADEQIVPFFKEIAEAVPGVAISIYETQRAKIALTLGQHQAIHQAVPTVLMVKSNENTLGASPEGCKALSEFVNVFAGEEKWDKLGPCGAVGSCSSLVYYNPRVILGLWKALESQDWATVGEGCAKLGQLMDFYFKYLGDRGYTDTSYDRMGALAGSVLKTSRQSRGPYPSARAEDIEALRAWYGENWPEMLETGVE